MQPYFEKWLDLTREDAGFFPPCQHIANPLAGSPTATRLLRRFLEIADLGIERLLERGAWR
jgi:hypothetical protein